MSNAAQTNTEHSGPNSNPAPDALYLPFRDEVFNTFTPLQIRILLSAREIALRGNGTQQKIAQLADSSPGYVTRALTRGINRHDLPVVYTLAKQCIGDKTYEELTTLQQQIINYRIVRPNASFQSIADRLDCARVTVLYTCRQYSDIVDRQSPSQSSPKTSAEANDIPIDDLLADSRNSNSSYPPNIDPDSPLLDPFTNGLLESLPNPYRHTLLAGREWALRSMTSYKAMANVSGIGPDVVRNVISGFRHYDDRYPTAASVAAFFVPNHSYETLTDSQQAIVNAFAIDPTASTATVAEQSETCVSYTASIRRRCRGIIYRRRKAIGASPIEPSATFRLANGTHV